MRFYIYLVFLTSVAFLTSCSDTNVTVTEKKSSNKNGQISREEYDRYLNERLEYYRAQKIEGLKRAEDCKVEVPNNSYENADCSAAASFYREIVFKELSPLNAKRSKQGLAPLTISDLYPAVESRNEGPIKEIPKFK